MSTRCIHGRCKKMIIHPFHFVSSGTMYTFPTTSYAGMPSGLASWPQAATYTSPVDTTLPPTYIPTSYTTNAHASSNTTPTPHQHLQTFTASLAPGSPLGYGASPYSPLTFEPTGSTFEPPQNIHAFKSEPIPASALEAIRDYNGPQPSIRATTLDQFIP